MRRCILSLLLMCASAQFAHAQSFIPFWHSGKAVQLDIYRPNREGADLPWSSFFAIGSARIPVDDRMALILVLPYARYERDVGLTTRTSSALGTPYIGIQSERGSGLIDAGLWIAFMDSNDREAALQLGFLADPLLLESVAQRHLSLRLGYQKESHIAKTTLSGSIASIFMLPKDGGNQLSATAGGRVTQSFGAVAFFAQGAGRLVLTGGGSFGERSSIYGGAGVTLTSGRVRPTIDIRFPLDKPLSEYMQNTLHAGVQFGL